MSRPRDDVPGTGAGRRAPAAWVRLLAATTFLTRLPVGRGYAFDAEQVGRGSLLFPIVGAGLGVVQLVPAGAAAAASVPLPPFVAALVGTVLLALATGALHLDALADASDGLGGGRTREDALRIMRDPSVGAYGAISIAIALIGRVILLDALLGLDAAPAVVASAALSRWSATAVGWRAPYARDDPEGVGAAIAHRVGPLEVWGSAALALGIALLCVGPRGIALAVAVGATALAGARVSLRRIGGVTGDTLGATVEVCDLMALTAAVALWSAGP